MMKILLLLSPVCGIYSAMIVENKMSYDVVLAIGSEEIFVPSLDTAQLGHDVGSVVKVTRDGRTVGSFLILGVNSTIIDDGFIESQQKCKDISTTHCVIPECSRNPGWMIVHCAKTCHSCHLQKASVRCNPDTLDMHPGDLKPGEIDGVFDRALTYTQYQPILAHESPNIVQFAQFLNPEELEQLQTYFKEVQFQRSTDQGDIDENGVQQQKVSIHRTSQTAWCQNDCADVPIIDLMYQRISDIVQQPLENFENFQFLKYGTGQYYRSHHDASESSWGTPAGPRLYTFFIYVNDVDGGGETEFPRLNFKVQPKAGSAVLWSSLKSSDPKSIDYDTTHAALPPLNGMKHGINTWIHINNFVKPNLWGCTGSFA